MNIKPTGTFLIKKEQVCFSAHLHFGTVGIREALKQQLTNLKNVNQEKDQGEIQTWINELLWREFYYHITFHNPKIM